MESLTGLFKKMMAASSSECAVCATWTGDLRHRQPLGSDSDLYKEFRLEGRDVVDASQKGCQLCRTLADILDIKGGLENHYTLRRNPSGAVTVSNSAHERNPYENVHIFCDANLPCPWRIFVASQETRDKGSAAACLAIAAPWLRSCVDSHDCGGKDMNQRLPTRLLLIGAGGKDIRLVNTNNLRGRYVCLSHCWGASRSLETTTENIRDLEKRIPWDDLPQVYQDAIEFTHLLGVSYLWIDSLCIIQNDTADWLRESSQMADIYSNGFITIAATRAKDSSETLFNRYKTERVSSGVTLDGQPYRLLARKTTSWHPQINVAFEALDFIPLLLRGWVFQERLLSRRFLHFGENELAWECRGSLACECRYPGNLFGTDKISFEKALAKPGDEGLGRLWRNLVSCYSELELSRPSDMLPALSGIAKRVSTAKPGSKYLAGLWSASLLDDLLWTVSVEKGRDDRGGPAWRAPTWSWASMEGFKVFPLTHSPSSQWDLRAAVLGYDCTPIGLPGSISDPTGAVSSGSIRLSGLTLTTTMKFLLGQDTICNLGIYAPLSSRHTFTRKPEPTIHWTTSYSKHDWNALEGLTMTEDPEDPVYAYGTMLHLDWRDRSFTGPQDVSAERELPVLCLRLGRLRRSQQFFNPLTDTIGGTEVSLVLRCCDEVKQEYERVGWMRLSMYIRENKIKDFEENKDEIWKHFPTPFQDLTERTVTIV